MLKNRTVGGVLLIAGTTIGAGMLAMPLACAGIGFPVTTILLLCLWMLTTYSALLLLEVQQYADSASGLTSLAARYLGRSGYWLTRSMLLLLLYSLIAAYLTAGGEQLAAQLSRWGPCAITPRQGSLLVALGTALVVSGGTRFVDGCNRLLFSLKMVTLLLMLLLITPQIQFKTLLVAPQPSITLLTAIPVLFTAFGFHATLPSIVHYLKGNIQQLRYVILGGSTLPLLCYLAWQGAIQGLFDQHALLHHLSESPGLSALMQTIQQRGIPSSIEGMFTLFATLALATSLLGVTLGLMDHYLERLATPTSLYSRFNAGLYTFLPPLLFAWIYPRGFMLALSYAAVALALLALLLPAALAWRVRQQPQRAAYQVWGGAFALCIVLLSGVIIMVIPLCY